MGRYTITIEPGTLTTLDEYANLPEEPGWRTELTDGRVVRMPSVKDHRHGWILTNLLSRLLPYILEKKLGKLTYQQEGYDVSAPDAEGQRGWAPDLAFVTTAHLPIVEAARARNKYPRMAPDLTVEIISPSEGRAYVKEKIEGWLAAGTSLLWVIWPNKETVDVWQPDEPMHTLKAGDLLDGLEVLPGFTMPVADLFVF